MTVHPPRCAYCNVAGRQGVSRACRGGRATDALVVLFLFLVSGFFECFVYKLDLLILYFYFGELQPAHPSGSGHPARRHQGAPQQEQGGRLTPASLLGAPRSTARAIVRVEMGWRSARFWIRYHKCRTLSRLLRAPKTDLLHTGLIDQLKCGLPLASPGSSQNLTSWRTPASLKQPTSASGSKQSCPRST